MHSVNVSNLSMSNMGFVVLLKSEDDERTLPIFIGVPEAQAIALHINGVAPPRPMTHDLLKNVLDVLEGRLEHVEVHDLNEGTFYGRLVLSFEGRSIEVDSRPSDAIALALRCHTPIFVAENVMDEAGIIMEAEETEGEQTSDEEESVREGQVGVDALQRLLEEAIKEERYEDAAQLRDEIRKRRH